ncbi:MAG: sulfurtransferase [Myxococcota bacterium]
MDFGPIAAKHELPTGVRWIDARVRRSAFLEGHVPGAVHADLERDLSGDPHHPERGGRHPLPSPAAFAERLETWGIRPDDAVVIYDDAGGAMAAARCWWMMRAIGHRAVAILDGGLAPGFPLEKTETDYPRSHYPAPETWLRPTVDLAYVQAHHQDANKIVLDVRTEERFRGEKEPIDPVAGSIPQAKNLPLARNLRPDKTFKSPTELRRQYHALLGSVSPEDLVVSCGSGVTACHTLAALEYAGLDGAALYVGSWSEWCRNPVQ